MASRVKRAAVTRNSEFDLCLALYSSIIIRSDVTDTDTQRYVDLATLTFNLITMQVFSMVLVGLLPVYNVITRLMTVRSCYVHVLCRISCLSFVSPGDLDL